jgi:dynactin-6
MFVCDEAQVDLTRVRVGNKSVLHPKSAVLVTSSSSTSIPPSMILITLGEQNIVDDMALLSLCWTDEQSTMAIGDNNLFESGSIVYAKKVGNRNWFEPRCLVGQGVVVGDDCVIGAGVVVPANTIIPNNSILVRLPDGRIIRREQKEFSRKAKQILHDKYIDAFTVSTNPSYLPRNHRMKGKQP